MLKRLSSKESPFKAACEVEHAAFTIGAEADDVINVAVQLLDPGFSEVRRSVHVDAYLSDLATGLSVTSAAPTVAVGTNGVALPFIAGKAFKLISDDEGRIDLDITHSGAKTRYLVLCMPNGSLVISGAITHGA